MTSTPQWRPARSPTSRLMEDQQSRIGADIVEASGIVEEVLGRFGRIDVLVNNAGVAHSSPFAPGDAADVRRLVEVHVFGTVAMTAAAWESLRSTSGRVVNVTSGAVFRPPAEHRVRDTGRRARFWASPGPWRASLIARCESTQSCLWPERECSKKQGECKDRPRTTSLPSTSLPRRSARSSWTSLVPMCHATARSSRLPAVPVSRVVFASGPNVVFEVSDTLGRVGR